MLKSKLFSGCRLKQKRIETKKIKQAQNTCYNAMKAQNKATLHMCTGKHTHKASGDVPCDECCSCPYFAEFNEATFKDLESSLNNELFFM